MLVKILLDLPTSLNAMLRGARAAECTNTGARAHSDRRERNLIIVANGQCPVDNAQVRCPYMHFALGILLISKLLQRKATAVV